MKPFKGSVCSFADEGYGLDDSTVEKTARAIAWGELGVGVKVQSFWRYFERDRARFCREARRFLTMQRSATTDAPLPMLHGLALAITHGLE